MNTKLQMALIALHNARTELKGWGHNDECCEAWDDETACTCGLDNLRQEIATALSALESLQETVILTHQDAARLQWLAQREATQGVIYDDYWNQVANTIQAQIGNHHAQGKN